MTQNQERVEARISPVTPPHAGDNLQEFRLAQVPAERRTASLQIIDMSHIYAPEGPQNPPPETWEHDGCGRLTKAGSVLSATYNGLDLESVTIAGETFKKTGPNEVTEYYQGNDGKPHTSVMHDVTAFTLTERPQETNSFGPFKSVELETKIGAGGGMYVGAAVWTSYENQDNYWKLKHANDKNN